MTARFITGDSLTVLRTLPDASVDLVLTSPPFLALRSYLPADDPNKPLELGSEATPGAFLDALLDVVEECRRVLAPHGSLCVELGDTYAGSGGGGGDYLEGGLREGQAQFAGSAASMRESNAAHWRQKNLDREAWPLDKSLCLVPELFRFALVYGFNPLTGRETPRWRARNVVRWCRPNPPVGALADKVRPATSDIVIVCVGQKRYFDLDAVRTPLTEPGAVKRHSTEQHNPAQGWSSNNAEIRQNENGAPPLDHWWHDDVFDQDAWLIPTQPYQGSHYATWPEALVAKPIEAMCPRRVCTTCGQPSERITARSSEYEEHLNGKLGRNLAPVGERLNRIEGGRMNAEVMTVGWSDCGCPGGEERWRTGIVLDPFGGSGTTGAVAIGHGRDAILIDLDPRNAFLARERIGMFLEIIDSHDPDGVRQGA